MSTLLFPSSRFAKCRVSLGRSRLVAVAIAVAAACQAFLFGPDSVDAECGLADVPRVRSLRPGLV